MPPGSLTLLALLRPGSREPLGRTLRAIGDDIRGRRLEGDPTFPHIHFTRSDRIHFARFAIVEDPEGRRHRDRLLYAATFDGTLSEHIRELLAITTHMQAIWGHCQGYTGVEGFPAFVRAHAREPEALYIAFREGSVEAVRRGISLRRKVDAFLEADPAEGAARLEEMLAAEHRRRRRLLPRAAAFLAGTRATLRRLLRAAPIVVDVARAVGAYGFGTVWRASLTILATLDRYPAIRILNRVTGNRLPPMGSHYSSLPPDRCNAVRSPGPTGPPEPGDLPPSFREDVVAQNQLTLVTGVEPGQVLRLRAVLAAVQSLATRLSPPGSLTGISTIHFVRWLVLDDDRRLLMLSDYDGSWENYIDEFAEMILSGLDAIWGGATGYPPDGARDLPGFKHFLRTHQLPAQLFYSAYPDTTTLNILSDRELAREAGFLAGELPVPATHATPPGD